MAAGVRISPMSIISFSWAVIQGYGANLEGLDMVLIRLENDPARCLFVPDSPIEGDVPAFRDCDINAPGIRFMMSREVGSRGQIRPSSAPSLCLNAPGAAELKLLTCSTSPPEHILWSTEPDHSLQLAGRSPGLCLVETSSSADGDGNKKATVQLCSDSPLDDRKFRLQKLHSQDCLWKAWTDWFACSAECGLEGQQARKREIQNETPDSGGYCADQNTEWRKCLGPCARAEYSPQLETEQIHEVKEECARSLRENVDVAVSVMLLGAVLFVMSLFSLVNWPDEDMRYYSWKVISKTVSLFTAVLMYQGVNGIIDALLDEIGTGLAGPILASYAQLFCFFGLLHIAIRRAAKQIVVRNVSGKNVSDEMHEDDRIKLACWSQLGAHLTGFAGIAAGAKFARIMSVGGPIGGILSVFVNVLLLFVLFRVSDKWRNRNDKTGVNAHWLEIWEETSEESENEAAGLCLSLLLTQACLRLMVHSEIGHSRRLAEEEAKISNFRPGVQHHPDGVAADRDIVVVILLGIFFAGLTVFSVYASSRMGVLSFESKPGEDSFDMHLMRWWFVAQSMFAMGCAWSFHYATKWVIARNLAYLAADLNINSTAERVFVALVTSLAAILLIFVLDHIEGMNSTGVVADRCVRSIIMALSILIGCSWESAFEGGVEVLAELSKERGTWWPVWVKLFLAICVAFFVVPPWRLYILKTQQRLEDARHEHQVQASHATESGVGSMSLDESSKSLLK